MDDKHKSMDFGQISSLTMELSALEHLKNIVLPEAISTMRELAERSLIGSYLYL